MNDKTKLVMTAAAEEYADGIEECGADSTEAFIAGANAHEAHLLSMVGEEFDPSSLKVPYEMSDDERAIFDMGVIAEHSQSALIIQALREKLSFRSNEIAHDQTIASLKAELAEAKKAEASQNKASSRANKNWMLALKNCDTLRTRCEKLEAALKEAKELAEGYDESEGLHLCGYLLIKDIAKAALGGE